MFLSMNWISDFVDLSGLDKMELIRKFSLSTAEVENEIDKVIILADYGFLIDDSFDVYLTCITDEDIKIILNKDNIQILNKLYGFYLNWREEWQMESADLERMVQNMENK